MSSRRPASNPTLAFKGFRAHHVLPRWTAYIGPSKSGGRGAATSGGLVAENEASRIARDIFVFTVRNGTRYFLCKQWASPNHRAGTAYGNAFGSFLTRPPKSAEELTKERGGQNWDVIQDANGNSYFNSTSVEMGFLCFKQKKFDEQEFRIQRDYPLLVVTIPSKSESPFSTIAAGMTTIARFVEVEDIEVEDCVWQEETDATDVELNIHAGVIQTWRGASVLGFNVLASDEAATSVLIGANIDAIRAWVAIQLSGPEHSTYMRNTIN